MFKIIKKQKPYPISYSNRKFNAYATFDNFPTVNVTFFEIVNRKERPFGSGGFSIKMFHSVEAGIIDGLKRLLTDEEESFQHKEKIKKFINSY